MLGERIEVFVDEEKARGTCGLRSIGVYGGGDDDARDDAEPLAVVFRGAGHYEALARRDDA